MKGDGCLIQDNLLLKRTFGITKYCPLKTGEDSTANSDLTVFNFINVYRMARGHQKIQSQMKNKEKMEKMKKSQGHDQKKAAAAGLKFVCASCKVRT